MKKKTKFLCQINVCLFTACSRRPCESSTQTSGVRTREFHEYVCIWSAPPPPPCYFSMLYRYFPSFLASFISICTNKHTHPYPERCAVTVIPGYTPTYYNFRGWHGDAETGSSSEPEIIHFRQRVVILTASVSKSSHYSPLWKSIRLLWEG